MYVKILILLVLAILCTGCTDPDLPDPYEFENVTPGAPALQKSWNPETQTTTISTLDDTPRLTIRKVSAVPDLCTFEEVLEIKSFIDYDLNKLKDFRARWQKHKGQHDITKVEWFILKNQSYSVTVDDYEIIQVEETHYNNVTEEYYNVTVNQTILTGNHSEVRYRDVWKPFSPIGKSIYAGQIYTVKIVYHKPAELGNVQIQTIPMFAGVECEELTWWNSSWNYRRNITINHSQVDVVMTDFPTMVSITQLGLNTDGNDTRITDSSGNQVAREIEYYNETSGDLVFFFNGTSISNTSDTSFWMYYNNSAASEPAADSTYGSQAVWDSNYVYVSHMADLTTGSIKDSTANGRTSTKLSTNNPIEYDAPFGKAQDFSSDYITIPDSADFDFIDYTFESYHNKDTDASGAILSKFYDGSTRSWEHIDSAANDRMDSSVNAAGTPHVASGDNSVLIQNWYYTALRHDDSSTSQWYIDGSVSGSAVDIGAVNANAAGVKIGDRVHATSRVYFDGKIAEVRLSNILRSIDYVSTTSNNLHNPTATGTAPFFLSFGAEEYASIITAYTPSTPLSKTVSDSQRFTVNTSENSQCRWYINGSLMQTNSTGATRHEYTNTSLDEGYWNFTATANTTNMTSSQTWWVTVSAVGTFEQDMYIDRWMYVTCLDGSNTNLSEFFTDLSPYYLSFYNATDQKTYNYKSGRWEKYADKIIKPGDAAMLRYTSGVTKTRGNASGTFGFTMKTGLNHIGHSYNGTRNLTWYNTTISSTNLVTIAHQNPETGALSTFTYGSADNGSVDVLQGCGVEVNVSADTVISGL